MLSSHGGFLASAVYHHRESMHYDETEKRAHDCQIDRAAKENLKFLEKNYISCMLPFLSSS